MQPDFQQALVEMPEQPVAPQSAEPELPAKLRTVNRQQSMLAQIWVEELIAADHPVRAIWELVGRLDLARFREALKTREGQVGRAAWDPRLLVSVWVYAYSQGISSAREIERLMEWEPGLQWLTGLDKVNHHSLSDFRVEHGEALEELFAQVLAMLQSEGLLSLERVMHDGTKVRAQAGADTFRREKTLREHLAEARKLVASMGDPRAEAGKQDRGEAARQRAAREREQRLEAAVKEWEKLTTESGKAAEKEAQRVSMTEPEARRMKHGDHAIAPSYNAQLTTEAQNKIIVGAHLTQCSSDAQSLMPAIEQVEKNLQQKPVQVVVDGGFTNRNNIIECAAEGIDLVGHLADAEERSEAAMKAAGIDPAFAPHCFSVLESGKRLECPAGHLLEYRQQNQRRGDIYHRYQARAEDCADCVFRPRCCPKNNGQGRIVSLRIEEQKDVAAFRSKMQEPATAAIYRQRGAVAEFPNAWIKEKLGLRKFRVRGLRKAGAELLWACLTYNLLQWIRLRRVQPLTA